MSFKPLLAAPLSNEDMKNLKYPLMVSPKLDGIRCIGIEGKAMSRTLKPIPNRHVQSIFADGRYDGLDGELIVGLPTSEDCYRKTNSAVMSRDGEPAFVFHLFDRTDLDMPFADRFETLYEFAGEFAQVVPHVKIHDEAGLLSMETQWLAEGYEGVMGRSLTGKYKHGRSTLKEGILWKLKRFSDHEYEVIGFEELMRNHNEAEVDELGYMKRSSAKEGKVGADMLGALVLSHPLGEFRCGSGFTEQQRIEIWHNRGSYFGKLAKIKHFEIGVKDLPRFPIFLGFRAPEDIGW